MTGTTNNTEVGLKEYFERILDEKDKALTAALIAVKEENRKTEVAAEKRFELLNELRGDVATKAEVKALEKVIEDLRQSRDKADGKGAGINQIIAWIIAGLAVAGFIIDKIH